MHCTSWYRQTVTYCNWKKRCVTSVSLESLEGKSVHGSKIVKTLVFWCHKWSKQTKSGDGHLLNSSSIWKKLIGPRKMVGFWTNSAATKSWFKKKKTVIPFGIPKSPGKILTSHLLLETNVQAREELEDSQGPPHGRRVLTNQGTSEGATIGGSWWKPWDQPVITGCYPRFLILILMFPLKLEL